MDFLKKIELLLSAKTRAALPRRSRRSALDEQEAEVLGEIRQALGQVEAQERQLAERIKTELAQAEVAAKKGDLDSVRAHERRADELERRLEQESVQALQIEEKLRALEDKLALAKEAVAKEAHKATKFDTEASKALAEGGLSPAPAPVQVETPPASEKEIIPDDFAEDAPEIAAKKSRLSD
ncbi:MAG TPA: hypothetical protein PKD98_15395 [Anaerolineae bacterium]|nr:hypothetical protein [Anaerolineae bacterium]